MITTTSLGHKIRYRESTSDEAVIDHSFRHDIFYPAIPDLKVRANVIIDVGAHIGTFSILSASKFPQAVVYAFEPNNESFELLSSNIDLNDLKNIKCQHMALTRSNGQIKLYLDDQNWGHSTSHNFGGKVETVNSTTLSAFFLSERIEECDLIKFNCEGAEFEILFSLPEEQLRKIGMMLILFHEDLASGQTIGSLYKRLRKNGFACRIVNHTGRRGWLIAKNRKYYGWGIPKRIADLKIVAKEMMTWVKMW